jgi:hypothetical protein
MKKYIFIIVKTFKVKGLGKWFGHFWFFNHSLKWFLMVPLKDWFAQKHNQQPRGQGNFNMTRQTKQTTILHNMIISIDFSQSCLHHFCFFFTFFIFMWIIFHPFYCLKRNMKMCDPKVSSLSFFYFFVLLGCLRICLPFNMTFITFIKLLKSSSNSWWASKY